VNIPFAKLESVGNDFVLVEARHVPHTDLAELARRMCARRFGVGSDGLLIIGEDHEGWCLRMFNPDGSEDFCGNGLRCAVSYAHRRMDAPAEFSLWHRGLSVSVSVAGGEVTTILPPATYAPEEVPHTLSEPIIDHPVAGYEGSALSTGSTHFVIFREELPDDEEFFAASPKIEHACFFPDRTSVMWAKDDDDTISIRIWERGVGETLGCGTGATAVAVEQARRTGQMGEYTVRSKGGSLAITVDALDQPLRIVGQPHHAFDGVWSD
jgi:diaminopimelate epimerase